MHKYVNGKYHKIHTSSAPDGAAPPENPVDRPISREAASIMKVHPHIDWSGVPGTGKGGQVTKKDAQTFLAGK